MDTIAYEALRNGAAWIDLAGRGKIRVTGDDRARLLHAMSTNNVTELMPGSGCYAFFLSPQGRILADVDIYCLPDYFLLDTEPETKTRVMEHLEKFIIADDVTLHDFTEATATICIEGPDSERVLNALGGMPAHVRGSLVEWGHCQIAHWSYSGGAGYSVFVPADEKAKLTSRLSEAGIPEADLLTADVVRLENGQPRYGTDFNDAQIPQETGRMQAIHFAKGCYLGQEIVERVRSRGHVNRQLSPIEIDSPQVPIKGATVKADGKDSGEITSAAWSPVRNRTVAIAMIRAEALRPGVALTVNGAPVIATNPPTPTKVS